VNFDSVKVRGVTFVTVTVTTAAVVHKRYFALFCHEPPVQRSPLLDEDFSLPSGM